MTDFRDLIPKMTDEEFKALVTKLIKSPNDTPLRATVFELVNRWETAEREIALLREQLARIYPHFVTQLSETPDHSN